MVGGGGGGRGGVLLHGEDRLHSPEHAEVCVSQEVSAGVGFLGHPARSHRALEETANQLGVHTHQGFGGLRVLVKVHQTHLHTQDNRKVGCSMQNSHLPSMPLHPVCAHLVDELDGSPEVGLRGIG